MRSLLIILLFLVSASVWSQYDFCVGSKGDPIYHQNFEGGNAALPSGFTNYQFVTGDPNDGEYTVSSQVGQGNSTWHPYFPSTTISNGKALVVNASYTSGQFFSTTITGLCQNTTYEFSAFLMNVYDRSSAACEDGGIPVDVRFEIWDETNTTLLKVMSSGEVTSTSAPKWERFGLTFRSGVGQASIILKMFNNGEGGCGNDLAIDDIIFRSCGDLTLISSSEDLSDELDFCEENIPAKIQLTAFPDYSVYTQHYYQWQASDDQQDWKDLQGENTNEITIQEITKSMYFRVKVAEDKDNLSGNYCNSASEPFLVKVVQTPDPPRSNGDRVVCSNVSLPILSVLAESGEKVNWYDKPLGGQLLAEHTSVYQPGSGGTYYAEALKEGYACTPGGRTAVTLTVLPAPEALPQKNLFICDGSSLKLDAGLLEMTYLWSTGQTSSSIEVTGAGDYSVVILNSYGCSVIKDFKISLVDLPVIKEVTSNEQSVRIQVEREGDLEFSLDGQNFQRSNVFNVVKGGIYTAYVRNIHGCNTISKKFAHVVIPEFITPNNDGYNDYFVLKGIAFFGSSEVEIFDRYGKLLKAGQGSSFQWGGKVRGKDLPADDYWYQIKIEGFEAIKGSFSLVR